MENTLYELAFLFFRLFFWRVEFAETAVATIKNRDFRNRGFLSGPFCLIYGFSAIVVTVMLRDLTSSPAALFLGSTIITTAIEWITGLLLERMDQKRWWDYSQKEVEFRWIYLSAVFDSLGHSFLRCCLFRKPGNFICLPPAAALGRSTACMGTDCSNCV